MCIGTSTPALNHRLRADETALSGLNKSALKLHYSSALSEEKAKAHVFDEQKHAYVMCR
jgi:hypothetical protein